ncbi:PDGLE domain-containing protein [Methanoregula sp.]|uniref:PDGLE domain-containing protein n=1 Tax=Methanoregula sp. TaxID=2052170 RepID=UPI003BB1DCDA
MDKTLKVLIIAMAVLVIIVPIGLIATGTAFGEWGPDELQQAVGFVPAGLQQLSDLWHPLLPDYDFPGGHETLPTQAPGYYISAIVGVLICAGVGYLVAKAIIRRTD